MERQLTPPQIFEPSEIASRLLTTEDDAIRALDIPERMQLASIGLPAQELNEDDLPQPFLTEDEIVEATVWMSAKISSRCSETFVLPDQFDERSPYQADFIAAVQWAITFINVQFLEVPYIWSHRADYFVTYPKKPKKDTEEKLEEGEEKEERNTTEPVFLLNNEELWAINGLSIKYRALAHRKMELFKTYQALEVDDEYFEELYRELASVEEVSDLSEWLAMKFAAKLREVKELERELDADNAPLRLKRASREDRYESAKNSIVSQFAQVSPSSPSVALCTHAVSDSSWRFPRRHSRKTTKLERNFISSTIPNRRPSHSPSSTAAIRSNTTNPRSFSAVRSLLPIRRSRSLTFSSQLRK